MTEALLTLNAGSSSLKFRLFGLTGDLPFLAGGKISGIGSTPQFEAHISEDSRDDLCDLPAGIDAAWALSFILSWLKNHTARWPLAACAHRIVHGGPDIDCAQELNPARLDSLRALIPLAPLHQPHNLAAVTTLWQLHPGLRQFGCFDTAFHAHHDALRTALALPADIRASGVRRYGFHGLSYAWIAHRLAEDLPHLAKGRVIAAHLGNGASLCAMKDGRSIDTTMGMTALDGLPMGTRCGSLDPGAILYMQEALELGPAAIENILYNQSGLKGLSGVSNDVEILLKSDDPQAAFALDYFALKAAQHIAAMAVSIGGIDAIVLTGGIGEKARPVRDKILDHLDFLRPFETHIIPTNEERFMALEVRDRYFAAR